MNVDKMETVGLAWMDGGFLLNPRALFAFSRVVSANHFLGFNYAISRLILSFFFGFFSKVAGKSKFSRHPENMSRFWTLKVKFRCYLRKNIRYLSLNSLLLVKQKRLKD